MCWLCGEIVTEPHRDKLDLSHYNGDYNGKTCVNVGDVSAKTGKILDDIEQTVDVRCKACCIM
jgi:hypothetical protein